MVPDLTFFLDKVSCFQADVKLKAKDDVGVLVSTPQLPLLNGELQACTIIPGLCDIGKQTDLLSISPDVI